MSRAHHHQGGQRGPHHGGGGGGRGRGGGGGGYGGGQDPAPGPRPLRLITNSFAITTLPNKTYYQYDVFQPAEDIRTKRVQLFHHLQTTVAPQTFHPRAIYDGMSIAYSPGRLPLADNGNATFTVQLGTNTPGPIGTRGVYQIRLTLTVGNEIEPNHVNDTIRNRQTTPRSLVATNLIQMIIRQGPNLHYTNNGRAYFTEQNKLKLERAGLELWRGIFQSVRPSLGRMILTIDTCTAAVYQSGEMLDIVMEMSRKSNTRDLATIKPGSQDWKKLESHFKGRLLEVKTGNNRSRTKTFRGLVDRAGEVTFIKNDQETTVARHFWEAYRIRIENPSILGVRLSKKEARLDVVPLQLCKIKPGQLYRKKLPEEYTKDMVTFATMGPAQRRERIQAEVSVYDKSEFVAESGMVVDRTPIGVDARLLKPPEVIFHPNSPPIVSRNGGWNALRQTFSEPMPLKYWVIADFSLHFDQQRLDGIGAALLNACTALGMPTERHRQSFLLKPQDVEGSLDRMVLQLGVQSNEEVLRSLIVIVILPTSGAHIRVPVKYWGDVKRGVHTQCLRENKVDGANDQYWKNIALKLNARLGGANFRGKSAIMEKLISAPYMVMGADVGHPGPGVAKPSVVGVVYSHDRFATKYAALTGIQQPRKEEIIDLKRYIYRAVENWGMMNQRTPRRIIFFRDGLSEGEFDKTARGEITDIQIAIDELWKRRNLTDEKPLVTYIVVGKRHHAVFFPDNAADADRTGNCPPGALIDGGVTHPFGSDFYLQSHAAIKGTCRSSHYTVLEDNIWNPNKASNQPWNLAEIQDLAYTLCHVYAKATRSVSIPAPVYYADLVCSRGAFHVQPGLQLSLDDNASVVSGSSNNSNVDIDAWNRVFRPVHERLKNSMYFL